MSKSAQIHSVTSLDLPGLEPYRTMRRPLEHFRKEIFVAEGEKVVRRLMDSNLTIISILVTPEWHDKLFRENQPEGQDASRRVPDTSGHVQGTSAHGQDTSAPTAGATIYIAEKRLLESIVGFNLHQGIMAVAKMPRVSSLEVTIASLKSPFLLVALDGLVSAENVGVVVRNCAAFGVDALIVGETSSSPYLRRAVRNSMGAVFRLPVVHVDDLAQTLRTLSLMGRTMIVAAAPGGNVALPAINLKGNLCLVLGNEDAGISPPILELCHARVAIPMADGVDSLNVGSASAVFLYEAARARAAG